MFICVLQFASCILITLCLRGLPLRRVWMLLRSFYLPGSLARRSSLNSRSMYPLYFHRRHSVKQAREFMFGTKAKTGFLICITAGVETDLNSKYLLIRGVKL